MVQKGLRFGNSLKRMLSIFVSICLMATILPLAAGVAAAETTVQSIITDYQPTINEVIDASGFKHPGVGLTKDFLENVRTQVRAQKEPWNSYFNRMLLSPTAAKNVGSSIQGADPTKPKTVAVNSKGAFVSDGLLAYTQALMYIITGDEVYRANAMRIIRLWEQMDPNQYTYFTDSHIHMGIPLNRMVTAAEILRYSSTQNDALQWTDKDTADFTNNLITPMIETFCHFNDKFMNQHLYPLLGAMSGYIFTGNRDRYNEGVEWFTVNKTAVDQGQNGAIKSLFRLVDTNALTGEKVDPPVVQHVEMGRDQAHGAGDITNMEILARLLLAQGTKVDPVDGTASTAPNAVGPYEFLDNRILKAADFFGRFMLGYDTPWIPVAAHTDANGNPTVIYKQLKEGYRGRIGGNVYDLYYYYKYTAGLNMEVEAPYFTEMFNKRHYFYWESPDAGADYWLYIPKEAEAEGTQTLPKPVADSNLREIEDRYTKFDSNSKTMQEGDTSFVRMTATEEGSKIALVASSTGEKTIGFKIRTNGTAKLEIIGGINDTMTLPDTKGQWRYVTYKMSDLQFFGDLVYFKVKGAGTTVDIDHINVSAGTQLTPPVFHAGIAPLNLFVYVDSEAAVKFDFSAVDANAADVVSYQIDNKPEGAVLNESTGAFTWKPTQAGTYSFAVGASDGTTIAMKDVKVVVTNDRKSAVAAVVSPYNPNTSYILSTFDYYKIVYADVMNQISSASDDAFYQLLIDLNSAVHSLKELNPLLQDGSMNYQDMFVSSTFGTAVATLSDNNSDSFVCFCVAQNLTHYMDFGPNYKISANAFELQVRVSFPDRIGGAAMFGSNDKLNWTRLTPGLTTYTEDMQRLEVQDDLKNQQFRFLKMQIIKPGPTPISGIPMLEVAEFRIHGERHAIVTQIPGTIAEALAEAAKLPAEDYTKQSYYLFQKELEYVKSAVGNSDYTEQELINEIYGARNLLVPYTTSLYSFEGNAKNTFGSSSSTDGAVFGTAAYAAGKVGQAISLNGTDSYMMLPATQPLSAYNEITLATWVYWNGSSQWQRIFDFGNNSNQYMFLSPRTGSNKLRFEIKNGGSAQGVETAQLPANQWAHVAITLGNGTAKLYVNGTLKATSSGVTIKPSDFQPGSNYIGKSQFATDPLFNGMIDEFRVYNRVLSDAEIGAVYNQTGYGADNSLLTFLLDQAAAAGNAGIYTADSVQALQQAIPAAQAVAASSDASQAQVDAAADSLRAAYDGLVYQPGVPAIAPVMDKTVIAGNQLALKLHQLNSVTGAVYSVSGLPQGASFDSDKRTVVWTPNKTQGGFYNVILTAEANGGATSRTVKLTVKGQPVIAPGGTVELTSRQPFTYQVKATDPMGMALTYSAAKLPSGAALNPVTGVFTWTPTHANYGDNIVTFIVSNGLFTVSQTVDLKVNFGILPPDDYTKGSYYLYHKEAERILAAIALPGADKDVLVAELIQAEGLLVRVPLSLYSFEGNAQNSFGSTTATLAGNAAYAAGSVGQAISLNGTDSYVALPAAHPLSTYDEITLTTSVYWNGSSQWQRIFDFGNNTNQYMFLTPRSGGNTLRFAIKNGGGEQFVETSQLAANQWVHVAVTLGGGTAKLYVNGELKATKSGITIKPSDFKPSKNYIGKSQFSDPLFNGMIDEFQVYNHILTDDEIKAVYNNTAKWTDNSLVTLLMGKAEALDATHYTEASWQALAEAVANAKALAADATQDVIDSAAAQLLNALKALNAIPVFAPIPAKTVELGTTVSFSVYAQDSDEDTLTYSADSLPNGATFDSLSGRFDWKPKEIGDYKATFIVNDARSASASMAVGINVIDTLPPTTTDDAPQKAVNHDIAVHLEATDSGSGVTATYFNVDGGAQQTGNSVMLTTEGEHTLVYWSVDSADNVEQPHSVTVKIDKTAPVTAASVFPAVPNGSNGWYVHAVTVSLSAVDNLSGVAMTEYSLDGGSTWQSYTAPVTPSQDSKYTVSYRSTDNAGNAEEAKTISFNLDVTLPTITVSGLVYGTYSDSMDITPILMLSDNLSGVDSSKTTVTLSTYGEQQTVKQGATIPLYTLPLGSHTFTVTIGDLAGNMSSQTVLFQTTTSIQSIQALVTRFTNAGWIDNAGIANGLQSKLNANALADFIGAVQAQSGKHISAQAAGYLLRDAQYLLPKQ